MSQAFVIKQGDQISEGYFTQPAFGLFKDLPEFLAELFKRLQSHGLALNGIQFQNPGADQGETHLRCTLPGSVVRIFLDRLDISSNLEQGSSGHDQLGLSVVEALRAYSPQVTFASYTSVLQLHGDLPGARPEQVLARLAAVAPNSPGPLLTAGAVFYYGAAADRLSSSLNLEPSVLVTEGLFVRARVIYDAAKLEIGRVTESARRHLKDALTEFDLVLEGWT